MMKRIQELFAIILFVCLLMVCNYAESHYTRKGGEIIDICESVVTIKDTCGFAWEYTKEPTEHWEIGDKVKLKMHTNGTTNNIYDDKVLKITK